MILHKIYLTLMILVFVITSFGQTFDQIDSALSERIKTGSDSMQIKLIETPSLTSNKLLSVIGRSRDGWYGELYLFDQRSKKKQFSKTYNLTTKYLLIPKRNWETFIEALYELKILSLRSKYVAMLDGTDYTVKVTTQNSLIEWTYNGYVCNKKKYTNNDEQAKIIRVINGELKRKPIELKQIP